MRKNKKLAAFILLLTHAVSIFYPGVSYALTSGPTAPESSQFQPASITNLVDPFSGDFSYNIPLMDVDGYPINIAYSSGGGMDEEASWVGFGWNINPGSVNRTMKGIPDDFNGTDKIKKDYNTKPDITGGISINAGFEVFGLDFIGANATTDIFYNNKRGLGVEIGAGISATLSTAKHVAGEYTAGLSAGANLGITSNSQTGADINAGINMGISAKNKEGEGGSMGFRFGGGLNSRAGMKSTTLSGSFNTSKSESDADCELRNLINDVFETNFQPPASGSAGISLGSATTNFGMAFTPTITMPMQNESYSLSPQVGTEFWGFQAPTIQLTAHYANQHLAMHHKDFPAYGFLHSVKGRNDREAMLDFNREKDAPYQENTPTLSVPYITQDVFTATSHLGSSQFKANSNSTGIFFDSYASNTSSAFSLGIEFGSAGGIKGGADLSGNGSSTVTQKWTGNNDFIQNGDFSSANGLDGEDAYFKLVGEKSSINKDYLNKIADKTPVKVMTANVDDQAKAFSSLTANNNVYPVSSKIARNIREPKGEVFTPLMADLAKNFALDKTINNYLPAPGNAGVTCNNGTFGTYTPINRVNDTHKGHHISEVKLTKNDGMRLVYGTPVYNNEQVDITMSVEGTPAANNFINYNPTDATIDNSKGMDHYFSKETIPAYATSFLLSGICSPDYLDVTGNGISDDDLGSAVKFNYSLTNSHYNWRTPNGKNGAYNYANFSEGYKSLDNDDKASFSYGNKELWYAHSIESKNMIAIFRLGDREDGYGYLSNGALDQSSRQKRLDRIDLYTKAELLTNPANPTPVKSVHFEYDYSLFQGVPNNINGGGKLTLKSVYFTYGNSTSGAENQYHFTYNPSGSFEYQQYDRWGTYKDKTWNSAIADLNNNEFPYSTQNQANANFAVQKWQLSQIELPSGGKIKVDYESDDYAFVQNKRAMQMSKIVGYGGYGQFSDYQLTDNVYIQLPEASTPDNVKWEYFEDVDQLYFKSMVKLVNGKRSDELVTGFAKITGVSLMPGRPDVAIVSLEKRGDYHPVAGAAWQFMRTNLAELAYPYHVDETLGPLAFVKALITAIRNIGELVTPFETKAMRQGFASHIEGNQGYARIGTKYKKLGGGLRVKRVIMDDAWADMVGNDNGRNSATGMEFEYEKEYTAPDGTKKMISSGVASYEPMAGGEENPFRQPISYQQKAHLTSSIFTVEEPLGESYFPAPSVGYSQVTIRSLDAVGNIVKNGYSVKKFYTAKDFPTFARRTDLSKDKYNQSSILGMFNIDQGNSVVLSQGFYVENNDMHGKPLSEETFDGSGKMLAGTYYHYKSSGSEQLSLDNHALTLHPDGTVKDDIIGEEFQMYSDMREQITENIGVSMNVNLDVLFFAILTIPIPTFLPIVQSSHSGYEAASTIKVVNKYAIADKVTTIQNGSTMISENVLWDALTGQVLLTKTQNGFDDPLYSFSLPAYMVTEYERGMGAAYKNTGILFSNVPASNGEVPSDIAALLAPGDELGISGTNTIVWATNISQNIDRSSTPLIRLINKDGSLYSGNASLILLRSGRRNMMSASSYSVVSLKNPVKNGHIEIEVGTQILNSSAGTFSDEWTADTKNTSCINWPQNGGRMAAPSNAKVTGNLENPLKVVDIIQQQNATSKLIQNNLDAPVPVSDIILKQKKNIAAKTAASKECDPCTDLSYFSFEEYSTGYSTCVKVSYKCTKAEFPTDKRVVMTFMSSCKNGSQTQNLIIDSDHLSAELCFGDPKENSCQGVNLTNWYCEDKGCDPCDLSSYTIETGTGSPADGCGKLFVTVKYNCSTPLPPGSNIIFSFSVICNGVSCYTKDIIIDDKKSFGKACFAAFGDGACPCVSNVNLIHLNGISGTSCNPAPNCCPPPFKQAINPYYTGLKGNWRSKQSYVYTTSRSPQIDYANNQSKLPTNTRKGGIFKEFTTFYKISGTATGSRFKSIINNTNAIGEDDESKLIPNDNKWIASATVKKVNSKGQEVENKDALDKFSAAQFGFNELVTTAVASNARNNELAYDGFEDYGYSNSCGAYGNADICSEDGHFNFKKSLRLANGAGFLITNKEAHTGNYSVLVTAREENAVTRRLVKYDVGSTYKTDGTLKYNINASGQTLLQDGGTMPTFTPWTTKKYVVSGWIKGDVALSSAPDDASKAKIIVEGWNENSGATNPYYQVFAAKSGPKVEGWTRVMATFEIPDMGTTSGDYIKIRLVPGDQDTYFDDIRIHPYDANMKSFAYDFKTSRLMAELDENNYATFYEYNDEGQLLRNKKETEKGIVTLKETRSRVRKN